MIREISMSTKVKWKWVCLVIVCIGCLSSTDGLHAHDTVPSQRFSQHQYVPVAVHSRFKRSLDGGHPDHVEVHVQLMGQPHILDLVLNRQLLPQGFFLRTEGGGKSHVHRPDRKSEELCQYNGVVRGQPGSWVAVSTCDGVRGMLYDGQKEWYLEPGQTSDTTLVYDSAHLVPSNMSCGLPDTPEHFRVRREMGVIRGPYNSDEKSRYVELVLVVDSEKYKEMGEDVAKVYKLCKDMANIINSLYMPLNIFIALVGVVVWTESDQIELSVNGDTTLNNFLRYRRQRLSIDHPNDNAQLLTSTIFEKGVVGKALKGPICTYEFSGGVSMYHSSVLGQVATTVAHGMGHNFGMEHDKVDCQCADEKCIMATTIGEVTPHRWSSCSKEYVALAFQHGMDYCLRNKPTQLFDSPHCGNGFVEPGEQCDCGLPELCDNGCCNAHTCMLHPNATCAIGGCCDLQTCKPKGAGHQCRAADRECDLPEFCTGESEYCPEDVYNMDGEICSKGEAFCYQGTCLTHSDQCKLLWGDSGNNSDKECYDSNTAGRKSGNCGYDRLNATYIKCPKEHVYCGLLQCKHQNQRLEFGMEYASILAHTFINKNGSIIPCRTVHVDLGLSDVDPGLVPNGAKCGENMMCLNQQCVSVEDVRHKCPDDCNSNGVCNSKGLCHCKEGFAPPSCRRPPGGSVDSGPASPSQHDTVPSQQFTQHESVPVTVHSRSKRSLNGGHPDHIEVHVQLRGLPHVLDLVLNRQLLPQGFFLRTEGRDKSHVHRPDRLSEELCQYNGVVRGQPGSWVAVSTCDGVRGMLYDGQKEWYLEPGQTSGTALVYDSAHMVPSNMSCGFPDTPDHFRVRREVEVIRGPYNSDEKSRYVELVLVVDSEKYKEMGEDVAKVYKLCKDMANIINSLFVPLNIFIALVGVVVWTETDQIALSPNGDTTLTNFLHYRRERLVKDHPNDNAQLLTNIKFEKGVVGKALKGPICTYEFSGGVSMYHSSVLGLVATTVAHEMGHNFGMEHDNADCQCPDEKCIMAPSSGEPSPVRWSSCSQDYLALAFEHGMDYCLRNKPTQLFDSPQCGNGFVEPGEQCDCGLPEHCDNGCCNAHTCMLHSNATCATGRCCDLQTCKPKGAGRQCRVADHECDLPEFCTGESEYCPEDVYKMDGETCSKGKAFCYQGKCRTHSDQCKLLWGDSGNNSDKECYDSNTAGKNSGNCGYNRLNRSYVKCYKEHVYCGLLHCKHQNERLEFGLQTASILAHSFINKAGSIVPCRTAIVDLGLNEVDPGLAPNGAKCGENMMCVNQKCMAVGDLRVSQCPNDCNLNGVCNSKGHCHCSRGFAPPFCDLPGPGGSADSGPASDPESNNRIRDFTTALYVIFLGIVPITAAMICYMKYFKKNSSLRWRMTPVGSNEKHRGDKTLLPSERAANMAPKLAPPLAAVTSPINQVQKELIGQFAGFSIKPITNEEDNHINNTATVASINKAPSVRAPNRFAGSNGVCAVPPPAAPLGPHVSFRSPKPKQRLASTIPPMTNESLDVPDCPQKVKISAPVLEGTTSCAAQQLMPVRPAPAVPPPSATVPPPVTAPVQQAAAPDTREYPTLTRIANLMRQASGRTQTKPKVHIDKERLKNIEISHPIPVVEQSTEASEERGQPVQRAQSMREATPPRRPQTFGSMRAGPGVKRPTSVHVPNRPTSPPPCPPPMPPPNGRDYGYDDCLNLKTAPLAELDEEPLSSASDNIYAVIEESPTPVNYDKPISSGSTESMGLLGEIVNEIQCRNLESIYSTGTLKKKKKEEEEAAAAGRYENAPPSEYQPSDASSCSSSNGYLSPKKINAPIPVATTSSSSNQPTRTAPAPPVLPTIIRKTPEPVKKISVNNIVQNPVTSAPATATIIKPTYSPQKPSLIASRLAAQAAKSAAASATSPPKTVSQLSKTFTTPPKVEPIPKLSTPPPAGSTSQDKPVGTIAPKLTAVSKPTNVTSPLASSQVAPKSKVTSPTSKTPPVVIAPTLSVTSLKPTPIKSSSSSSTTQLTDSKLKDIDVSTYKPYSSSLVRSSGPFSMAYSKKDSGSELPASHSFSRPGLLSTPAPSKLTPHGITSSFKPDADAKTGVKTPPKVAPRPASVSIKDKPLPAVPKKSESNPLKPAVGRKDSSSNIAEKSGRPTPPSAALKPRP